MVSELEVIYVILAIQAVGMLGLTAWYYFRRLRLEERKVEIEASKLKLRRNGP